MHAFVIQRKGGSRRVGNRVQSDAGDTAVLGEGAIPYAPPTLKEPFTQLGLMFRYSSTR